MTEIPLAWLVTALSAIAVATIVRSIRLPAPSRLFLAAGFLALGAVGLLLGLRLTYQIGWAGALQPVVAVLPAPAFYLGLAALAHDGSYPWRRVALVHGAPIAAVLAAIMASGLLLADVLLPALTLAYTVLLSRLALLPGEAFVHLTARDSRSIRAALVIAIAFFAMSLVADLAILLSLALTGPDALTGAVALTATVLTGLVFVAGLIGVPLILSRPEASDAPMEPGAAPSEEDSALLARFQEMLDETKLFTDCALTVARAARRLGVPARALSGAVNRAAGTNVSRHINGFRIDHAARLLRETDLSVTEIMLEAGFVSKSTFNAEFRRVNGTTPSAWRAGG